MKIAVIIADGTEELEALTPFDLLSRSGVKCDLISVNKETVISSHGVSVKADMLSKEVDFNEYDGIVIPGGMPGATNISKDKYVIKGIKELDKEKKLIASICASPAVVLAGNGLLNERMATCYPSESFISLMGKNYTGNDVEADENLITANGPKSAFAFALAVCGYLGVKPKF